MQTRNPPLQVAVLWHDTVISERTLRAGLVTVGEALDNTLVLPAIADVGARHTLFEPDADGGWLLDLTGGMGGHVERAGARVALDGARSLEVNEGDWGQIDLGALAVFFRVGGDEEVVPLAPTAVTMDTPVLGSLLGALSLHLAVLIGAFLLYEETPDFVNLDDDIRVVHWVSEQAPVLEEPEVMHEELTTKDPAPQAPEEEGTFGTPDREDESRITKREGSLVDAVRKADLISALESERGRGPLSRVLKGTDVLTEKLDVAMAGVEGERHVGRGVGGMGLKGFGPGGDGRGFGAIGGRTKLGGLGPGKGPRTRLRTPKRTEPTVDSQPPRLTAGFCATSDIQRRVALRSRAVRHCYEQELRAHPELKGKLTVVWRIGLDGRVNMARIEQDAMGSRAVAHCVLRQIRGLSFPKPEGGQCQVRFPFVFNNGL